MVIYSMLKLCFPHEGVCVMTAVPFNPVEWAGAIVLICLVVAAALGGGFTLIDSANQLKQHFDPAHKAARARKEEAMRKAQMLAALKAELQAKAKAEAQDRA
jgi:hypothetical protein